MKSTAAGPAGVFEAGKVVTVDDAVAEQLVDAGAADLVEDVPEAAVKVPPENAMRPRARGR